MPTTLTASAIERSTFVITASFADHAGAAVTPKTLTWSLRNGAGEIVNGRDGVAVTPLASTVNIVLKGGDLALPDAGDPVRVLTLEGTYDSTLGTDLPLKDEVTFTIVGLGGVS